MRVRKLTSDWDSSFGASRGDFIGGSEYTVQQVKTFLKTIKGEWFLDLDYGTPMFEILGQKYNEDEIALLIKDTILKVETVQSIEKYSQTFDSNLRKLTISATGKDINGETFIVNEVTL